MSEPRFVHLRVHGDLYDRWAVAKTETLVKGGLVGMPALAITGTNICGLVSLRRRGHGARA